MSATTVKTNCTFLQKQACLASFSVRFPAFFAVFDRAKVGTRGKNGGIRFRAIKK